MVFIADGSSESRTRARVRAAVGERGPISARDLSGLLGLTPAAVRRHLDALHHDGAIVERSSASTSRRGRGRPARSYVLTGLGQEQLQTTYDGVATSALHFLADRAGDQAVTDFAEEQIAALEQRLRMQMGELADPSSAPLAERTEALAEAMSAEGFAGSTRPVGQGTGLAGIQLCQGHCPLRNVAVQFHEFCEVETEAIGRLLGVHVQRLATLAAGHHACTTFVPTGALTQAPAQAPSRRSPTPRHTGLATHSPSTASHSTSTSTASSTSTMTTTLTTREGRSSR